MYLHVIAAAANCANTGSWQQRWNCKQPVGWDSGGHFFQGAVPLVIIALVLLVIGAARSGSRRTATN